MHSEVRKKLEAIGIYPINEKIPNRDNIISDDDILDLRIDLNIKSVDQFIESM